LTALSRGLRGSLVRPADPQYDEARAVWNGAIDRRPAVIVRCAGTDDVIAALDFALSENLEVAARGGGHSLAGFSTCDGGGATWAEFDRQTQAHGLATTGGVVSTTGVGGFTLGGGIGYLARKHGLVCDNLMAAEVVTAAGRLVRAANDGSGDAELLWALRGGGGNFAW
jgi:FAD/FMN-containing dehydrogenase